MRRDRKLQLVKTARGAEVKVRTKGDLARELARAKVEAATAIGEAQALAHSLVCVLARLGIRDAAGFFVEIPSEFMASEVSGRIFTIEREVYPDDESGLGGAVVIRARERSREG